MTTFKARKEVVSLPSQLEADTIYAMRAGSGFDLFISDNTGAIAHKLNQVKYDDLVTGSSVLISDFIPSNIWSAIVAGTNTTPVESYIQTALDTCASTHATLVFSPYKFYRWCWRYWSWFRDSH